ncbi:MAG: 2-oxoglutarate dehydrogenase complex dihydrolipoyllysine-residue succinyltransferase [Paracoccaceae bacterium]
MAVEVRVPTLGESVTEATVASWYKKPGDSVATDEVLCELETDKVSVEVPSPGDGTLGEVVAEAGATVEVDALLATIEDGAGASKGSNGSTKTASGNGQDAPAAGAKEEAGTEDEAPAAGGSAGIEITVPALGESVTEATVASWFKSPGETVAADEVLCELETDKVSVEVPAPRDGTLSEIVAGEGATVGVGAVLARMGGGAAPAGGGEAKGGEAASTPPGYGDRDADRPSADAGRAGSGRTDVEDAPAAKKAMAEKGLSRDQVQGTGRDGRVMKEDVARAEAAPKRQPAPSGQPSQAKAPQAPADDGAREKRVKMTRLRQTIARRLKEAQNTAAMLTTYNEVDMTAVMDLRNEFKDTFEKKHGVRLGFMSFFVKAACHALKEIPAVNAEIDGDEVVYKEYCHIGVAVGSPNGLVVPVVRDADRMGFAEIEKTVGEFGKKARDNKLTMAEMQGGTFTISNGGVYGSLMSSPILNPPQSGILGMHKIQQRPMVVGGAIEARPMMYLALSYDHRIVDGKEAVTFLVRLKEGVEDPRRLLMDL